MKRLIAAAAALIAVLVPSAAYAANSAGTVTECTAQDLGAWLAVDQGNGALGTIYYPLQFTNLSGHACSLDGYPGVSVVSSSGQQLGSPAIWGGRTGQRKVILVPGATAHTILAYRGALVSTAYGCDQVNVPSELSVYPPGQSTATDAAFGFPVCAHRGPIYLVVTEPIRPNPGTING
jgi:hypothetical protein